ncbi:MAG TPA: hypothetical protein VIK26_00540 [Clostridium sp.]
MPRESTKVKVLTGRDTSILKQLSRTGLSNAQQAKGYCNLGRERLGKLEKSGYIKTTKHIVRGKNTLIIQLDKVGKEWCRQELGTTSFCVAQTNHLNHDLKLTEAYYNLPESVQSTWRHEGELIQDIYEKNPSLSENGGLKTCTDATVQVNEETIAIESVGSSYTSSIIELKKEIATQYLGCSRMECV